MKTSLLINLPAVVVGTIVAAVFAPANDSAPLGFAIPFVFPLWFAIGSWLDNKGWRRHAAAKRNGFSRVVPSLLRSVAGLFFLVGVSGTYEIPTQDG